MEKTKTFTDLKVWQKGHQFVLGVYKSTKKFPKEEVYGLTSQVRRASVSITANIAEGYKRTGTKDKLRFYNISQASLEECRYFLILSKDLEYFSKETYNELMNILEETSKMLTSYIKTININKQ